MQQAFIEQQPSEQYDSASFSDGWKAELELVFTDRGDKTVIGHKSQQGPLAVQRPLYPEGHPCHTYLLHPPGGVVGGDELLITATAQTGAHALVTTPGATKFYRSRGKIAYQKQILTAHSGSCLEWLPQENIFFPTTKSRVDTDIHLHSDALFMGWELHCFGRPALKECFDVGEVFGKTRIFIDKQLVLIENLSLVGGDHLLLNVGLQGFPMMGTLFISAQEEQDLKRVQDLLNTLSIEGSLVLAATQLEHLIVVRALGHWSETILNAFTQIWQMVRMQWFGYHAQPPRIWAT